MNTSEFVKQKLKTSEFRDVNAEKLLIACILRHPEVLRKCNKELREEVFSSDRCRNIYHSIIEFYNTNNVVFDTGAFEISLEQRSANERNSYKKLWKSILKLRKMGKFAFGIAIIEKLNRLYAGRMLEYGIASTLQKLSKSLKDGSASIEEAKKSYLDIIPALESKSAPTFISNPFDYYQRFKVEHMAIQKDPTLLHAIPTGLQQLDDIMGGLRPSEFGLITAGTGVGKSIMLNDFAFHCWKTIGDILYVTIEMPGNQLSERFYCRLSGIDYSNFRRYKLNEDHWKRLDEKIDKSMKMKNKFRILDIPQSITTKGLRIDIEDFIRKNGEPKLIVIDYMNILQGGFDWSKQLEIAVDLKQQIARYFKIATWSANQLMGSKHDKEVVKISDTAFAKNIFDNVDIGIGIGLTDASEEDEIFNISFTKTRDFKGKSFTICGDRSRMTFTKAKEKSESTTKMKKKEQIGGKLKT